MKAHSWIEESRDFLIDIDRWLLNRQAVHIADFSNPPERTAITSVDMINGFCHEGPLASARVAQIIPPIVNLFQAAWRLGINQILLIQDTHDPNAVEFGQFPPHCIRGTSGAEAVPEIKALPFFEQMITFPKNSIHSGLDTGLDDWISENQQVDQFIVVGDCTDLCTYQLAMHLRLAANAGQLERRVVLPLDCVDTYDLPIAIAEEVGGIPHNAELLHRVFLYSMRLNGIEIVSQILD